MTGPGVPALDVLIPARGGSVGLPGKNGRLLIDRPLLAHAVACAALIRGVRRILLSTDDPGLADIGRTAGAVVPELRPAHLATDDTPMADVIRYAVDLLERLDGGRAEFILLLDPTSPLRDPDVIARAASLVHADDCLDGAVSVSAPAFNPLWVGVQLDDDGIMQRHPQTPAVFTRRQDVPPYWRINGSFYLWRTEFAADLAPDWLDRGTLLGVQTPELLSHSIDTLEDFRLVEVLVRSGLVRLPWLTGIDESPDASGWNGR